MTASRSCCTGKYLLRIFVMIFVGQDGIIVSIRWLLAVIAALGQRGNCEAVCKEARTKPFGP